TVATATTVTNTNDSGAGSLREAINTINGPGSGGTIVFNIAANDPGYNAGTNTFTINLASSLPLVKKKVSIDGRSEAGAVSGAVILINGGSFDGLTLGVDTVNNTTSSGSTIAGLQLENFGASNAAIVVQSSDNTIGGTATGEGNTIAFNSGAAVTVAT